MSASSIGCAMACLGGVCNIVYVVSSTEVTAVGRHTAIDVNNCAQHILTQSVITGFTARQCIFCMIVLLLA